MSHKAHKRLTTWQKATALVPLALLSGAWTANLTVTSTASAAQEHGRRLPDGSTLPTEAIKAPASVSLPGEIAPGVPDGAAGSTLAGASTSGIPAVALAAYQRAAEVIDAADPSCHMQWPLVAAIGRVESNHGRYGGNTLSPKGISEPGIYGIPLDGKNGTAKVLDTDAGQYDHDPVYDRAVGPMQFIPSTWSVVGVDADGDGKRNPQDINDAALATAVYLCSGKENLSTPAGQRAAVFRYNHSQSYVDLVLAIMRAYASGDYSSVPNSSEAPTTFSPVGSSVPGGHPGRKAQAKRGGGAKGSGGSRTSSGKRSSTGSSGSTGTTGSGPSAPSAPSAPKSSTNKVTSGVKKTTTTVQNTAIGLTQATSMCTSALKAKYGVAPSQAVSDCANQIKGLTKSQAEAQLPGIVAGLANEVKNLTGAVTGTLGGLG